MEVEVKPIKQPHHAAALRAAFPATIPVLTGYLCIGMAYGLLMANAGYGVFWALLLSLLCYAGSMEFVAVSLLTAGFDPVQALLMALMINARHAFYGLSMLEKYRGTGWARPCLILSLTDETFSLVSRWSRLTVRPAGISISGYPCWITFIGRWAPFWEH